MPCTHRPRRITATTRRSSSSTTRSAYLPASRLPIRSSRPRARAGVSEAETDACSIGMPTLSTVLRRALSMVRVDPAGGSVPAPAPGGGEDQADPGRVHVHAVVDDLDEDLVLLQRGGDRTGLAVVHRPHRVEH